MDMSRTRFKKALVIVICIVSLGVVTTYVIWNFVPVPKALEPVIMRVMFINAQRLRIKLLYKTDHQALLVACRDLSKRVTNGNMANGPYQLRFGSDRWITGFSRPILDLRPSHVYINSDGRVILEMFGGLDHFGVYAYPEDYKKPPHTEKLGDKKLLDGLWYYDDGYQYCDSPEEYEEYDKQIEALRPKGK
jgi:hypothetical protein